MGPTLGGVRARHWNIVMLLCCSRLFEWLQTKSPEQTKKYIMNELLNYSMSDKQRETCESDQRLPRIRWGCQWQHVYLSEKARSHRVHGSAFMCLSNSLGSLPHTCVFFVHGQAGADLALEAGRDKSLTFTNRQNSGGERRRTEESMPNFNLYCEWRKRKINSWQDEEGEWGLVHLWH